VRHMAAKTYRALSDGYADNTRFKAGEVFTTEAPKGLWMELVEPEKPKRKAEKSIED